MGYCWNGMGWGGWTGMGAIGFILGAVLWAAVLALLAVMAIWLVRRLNRPSQQGSAAGETTLDAARRRLAKGEITLGEFDEIVHRLRGESRPAD
jgi:uncharacterized membrane protein